MKITYSKKATKFIQKQPLNIQKRIITAIEKLPAGDITKLQGTLGYRLRVGSFRVVFDNHGNVIAVIDIDNRGQVYK